MFARRVHPFLFSLVVLVTAGAGNDVAWAQNPPPGSLDAELVIDVPGNAPWNPTTNNVNDLPAYYPGYDMDGRARITLAGGAVTPQVFALILYVPNVVGGTVDFHLYKDPITTSYDGIDGNSAPADGLDFEISQNASGRPEVEDIADVPFTDATGSPYPYSAVIYVDCKDYGGFCRIRVTPKNVVIRDANGQQIPVPLPVVAELIPFIPGSASSDDLIAVAWRNAYTEQGQPTADVDESLTYQASVKGDHLSVFEEYRGLTIGGAHYTMPVARSFDGSSTGGTRVKDGFFEDDSGKVPSGAENLMPLLGVCWHQIQRAEMDPKAAASSGAKLSAGVVDTNTPRKYLAGRGGYRCLRYIDRRPASGDTASATDLFNDGTPIEIDVTSLETWMTSLSLTAAEKRAVYGYFATHEALHKVGVQHPPPHRMYVTPTMPQPGADGFLVETYDNPQIFGYWVIRYNGATNETIVGMWVAGSNKALDPNAPPESRIEIPMGVPDASITNNTSVPAKVHRPDGDWPALIVEFPVRGRIRGTSNGNQNPYIDVFAHSGSLADHIVNSFKIQSLLNPSDGAVVDVKR